MGLAELVLSLFQVDGGALAAVVWSEMKACSKSPLDTLVAPNQALLTNATNLQWAAYMQGNGRQSLQVGK
ncbi:hypothetical protein SNOG_15898 [Parastagonospora nodorum SN15]|uniref:Uncharacterized protein n=1 Tax=Phaeosphaeria nodorum (strain SN15 / ATCC MYA-4574 / FGSC 10173) TaxID=321614 RepID=Q0TX89_PHANO|nr:hypothetical protein SNOG_15898 [Parastagonospora nodorum SN15]EAT76736.1 hypothetical protein SNOG_15898 [Parastagonospora nodorum SN15]